MHVATNEANDAIEVAEIMKQLDGQLMELQSSQSGCVSVSQSVDAPLSIGKLK